MKKMIATVMATTAAFALSAPASATILTFDDLGAAGVISYSNYGGLEWTQAAALTTWQAVNIDIECSTCAPTGFRNGRTSGTHVGSQNYNSQTFITSATAFSMASVQLSSAWRDNLTVQFAGYLNGALIWSSSEIAQRNARLVTFDSSAINELRVFSTGGGAPSGGGSTAGAVFDDFTFNFSAIGAVPEPATWGMMVGGFGLIGASLRATRRRALLKMTTA